MRSIVFELFEQNHKMGNAHSYTTGRVRLRSGFGKTARVV